MLILQKKLYNAEKHQIISYKNHTKKTTPETFLNSTIAFFLVISTLITINLKGSLFTFGLSQFLQKGLLQICHNKL